jgi:hypothetical protein
MPPLFYYRHCEAAAAAAAIYLSEDHTINAKIDSIVNAYAKNVTAPPHPSPGRLDGLHPPYRLRLPPWYVINPSHQHINTKVP